MKPKKPSPEEMLRVQLNTAAAILEQHKGIIRVEFYKDNPDDPMDCVIEEVRDYSNERSPVIVIQVRPE